MGSFVLQGQSVAESSQSQIDLDRMRRPASAGRDSGINKRSTLQAPRFAAVVVEGVSRRVEGVVPRDRCDFVPPRIAVRDREALKSAHDLH